MQYSCEAVPWRTWYVIHSKHRAVEKVRPQPCSYGFSGLVSRNPVSISICHELGLHPLCHPWRGHNDVENVTLMSQLNYFRARSCVERS